MATLVNHLQTSVSQVRTFLKTVYGIQRNYLKLNFWNNIHQEKLSAQRVRQVSATFCKIQEFVKTATKLKVDMREFAFLKAIALFGPGMANLLDFFDLYPNYSLKCLPIFFKI